MRRRITVTEQDLVNGHPQPHYGTHCPIELAAQRVDCYIRVGMETYTYRNMVYPLTKRMRDFVRKYDNAVPVKPTTFYLEI